MTTENPTRVDPKRLVALAYVGGGLVLALFLEKLLALVIAYGKWSDPTVFGEDWTVSTLVAYTIAVTATVVAWRMPRVHAVAMEVAQELRKVTWPTMRETRAATIAVLVATSIAAVILGLFDALWARLSQYVY
jgi:preprotein translocase subunit SecE